MNDLKNLMRADTKFTTECNASIERTPTNVPSADFFNFGFGELMPISLASCLTLFLITVFHINLMRPNKEVIEINAGWSVAAMENTKTIWDSSKLESPEEAVSKHDTILVINDTIPLSVRLTSPDPTLSVNRMDRSIGIYFLPKQLNRCWRNVQWSPVGSPSLVVHAAQSASKSRIGATLNGAWEIARYVGHDATPSVDPRKDCGREVRSLLFGLQSLAAPRLYQKFVESNLNRRFASMLLPAELPDECPPDGA